MRLELPSLAAPLSLFRIMFGIVMWYELWFRHLFTGKVDRYGSGSIDRDSASPITTLSYFDLVYCQPYLFFNFSFRLSGPCSKHIVRLFSGYLWIPSSTSLILSSAGSLLLLLLTHTCYFSLVASSRSASQWEASIIDHLASSSSFLTFGSFSVRRLTSTIIIISFYSSPSFSLQPMRTRSSLSIPLTSSPP